LASSAAWVGCHADLGERSQQLAVDDAMGGDAYGGTTPGSDAGMVLDTIAVIDTIMVTDGSGEGGVPDAGSGVPDAGSGVPDAGSEGGGSDDGGTTTGSDDGGSGGGNPLQPGGNALDRTSFYACAGGPASAGLEVGLPIGLALVLAVRRRRRFRR
jgi:hypothetical protein